MVSFDDSFFLAHGIMKSKMSNYETSSFTNWCSIMEMKGGPNAHCKVRSSSVAYNPANCLTSYLTILIFIFSYFSLTNNVAIYLWVTKWWINTCILNKIIVMLIIISITTQKFHSDRKDKLQWSITHLLAQGTTFMSFAQCGLSFWSFTHVLPATLWSHKYALLASKT